MQGGKGTAISTAHLHVLATTASETKRFLCLCDDVVYEGWWSWPKAQKNNAVVQASGSPIIDSGQLSFKLRSRQVRDTAPSSGAIPQSKPTSKVRPVLSSGVCLTISLFLLFCFPPWEIHHTMPKRIICFLYGRCAGRSTGDRGTCEQNAPCTQCTCSVRGCAAVLVARLLCFAWLLPRTRPFSYWCWEPLFVCDVRSCTGCYPPHTPFLRRIFTSVNSVQHVCAPCSCCGRGASSLKHSRSNASPPSDPETGSTPHPRARACACRSAGTLQTRVA